MGQGINEYRVVALFCDDEISLMSSLVLIVFVLFICDGVSRWLYHNWNMYSV